MGLEWCWVSTHQPARSSIRSRSSRGNGPYSASPRARFDLSKLSGLFLLEYPDSTAGKATVAFLVLLHYYPRSRETALFHLCDERVNGEHDVQHVHGNKGKERARCD